jgi:RHS repeat-associated protein
VRSRVSARRAVLAVIAVLATAVTPVVTPLVANAEIGPSVPLPQTKSTSVTRQAVESRGVDQATSRAQSGNQGAKTAPDGSGTAAATPLSSTANWQVSPHTGDFTWSYPLRVPPAAGGLVPNLALSYQSSTVDGRTSVTNNQPSWVGEGWDLSPGFVERTYGSCADDTDGGTKPPQQNGDLCWRSDNATATYSGGGGMLIRDDNTGDWRAKSDDGSRIERLPGAGNDDDNGEHWKITTVDGTEYWFGSQTDSKSTWTVPVFGDDVNEPCNRPGSFDTSHCVQGWRWNLDKVVDRNGNMIRYYYTPESNSYGMNQKDAAVSYVRGGTLERIDYGLRDGITTPSGRVVFGTADRCVRDSICDSAHPDNWPDLLWENNCDTPTCKDKHSPSFWSTKRLTTITTQVWKSGAPKDVDRWSLDQQFPSPDGLTSGGEKAALWLRGIAHTGLVDGSVSLPAVTFEGTAYPNRVYKMDGVAPLNRYRVTGVISESGGLTTVSYQSQCDHATGLVPAEPHANTLRCFPVTWSSKTLGERTDYFHKYVVGTVVQSDRMSSNTQQVTSYEYLDGAGWHWDTSEFVKEEKKTWSEFRGYGRVRIRSGAANDPAGPVTMSEQRFYRGMEGDKLPLDGVRHADVSDTERGVRTDWDWLQGFGFESATFDRESRSDQPDPPRVAKTITDPSWSERATATRGPFKAYLVHTGTERGFTALASGGWRTTRTETTYDDRGLPIEVNDFGDTSTGDDDQCVTTTYARNMGKWLLNLPSRVETVSVNCGQTPVFPRDAIADSVNTFDGNGNVKQTQIAKERPASDPVYVTTLTADFDVHGRVISATDALGRTVKTKFTPAIGGPVTQTVSTTPATAAVPEGLVTTTTLEPAWGKPTLISDPNDQPTEVAYDAMGRSVAVWMPNRPKADNPKRASLRFSYQVRNDAPTTVTTTKIGPNGTDVTGNTLYDGLLRIRQVQVPAIGGGRLLTDTRYDSQGRTWKSTQPYFNDANVDTTLWVASDNEIPGHTRALYDGAGRAVESIYYTGATPKWRTTTAYGGDRVHVTPPVGGTTTTTITDANGQPVELRRYTTRDVSDSFEATRYKYTKAGQLASVTDAAGNSWRYTYDLRGRNVTNEDPDSGTSTMTYDDVGQLTTTRDAAGTTMVRTYDVLGRSTGLFKDAAGAGGTKLAEWTYDTVDYGKGKLASATRWVGDKPYTSAILNYNESYQPTGTSLTIPPSEGLLAGTYNSYAGYDPDGSMSNEDYPAAGELKAETVNYDYHDLGVATVTKAGYDGTTIPLVSSTDYTRYSEVARIQLGAGTKRAWLSNYYDTNTRRLERSIVDAEVPNPMQSDVHYTYNDAGAITSIADTAPSADVQCFKTDHLQRITEAWTPALGTWSETTGCSGNPSTAGLQGPAPYWHSYAFDNAGNRRLETQRTSAGETKRTYAYDVPGHAHALGSVTTKGPGVDTKDDYTYKVTGQTATRTRAGTGQEFKWDAEGHLASVTEGGKTTSFLYDANGSRLIRRDPDGTTLYLGNQELRVANAGGNPTVTRYYKHGGQIVAMRQGTGGLTWLAGDHQGTSQVAVNSANLSVTRRRQLPFGGPRGTAAAWPGDRGFVGGTTDSSTGLTHLGAREYDPATGRFISLDPVLDPTDPRQMNGYAYANNSPISSSDPSGLIPTSCPDGECSNGHGSAGGRGSKNPHTNDPDMNEPVKVVNVSNAIVIMQDTRSGKTYVNTIELAENAPPLYLLKHLLLQQEKGKYRLEWQGLYDELDTLVAIEDACQEECSLDFISTLHDNMWLHPMLGNDTGRALSDKGRRGANGAYLKGPSASTLVSILRANGKTARKAMRACSFSGDTVVLMADGSTKPIAEIRIGDEVLATDPETGEEGGRVVTAVMVHEDTVFALRTDDGGTLTTTEDHPFWNVTDRQWQRADMLSNGDQLLTATGAQTRVAGLRQDTKRQALAYNLTVDDLHTFYVRGADAAQSVLVHNSCEEEDGPSSFPNQYPKDKPKTPTLYHPIQLRGRSGLYIYVVDMDGDLLIGDRDDGHIDLSRGRRVRAAGTITLQNGSVSEIDNWSGHYIPWGQRAGRTAEAAFFRAGFADAIGKYVDKEFPS